MGILQLIASRNFIVLNKDIITTLGLEEAVLFGELCSEYDYWEKQDQLKDGYFFSTIENIEANTTLSDHKQRKAMNNLKDLGIIDIKIMGIPAKRYIKINEEQFLQIFNDKFLKNSRTSSLIFEELEPEILKRNNNITNNNITNNNITNNINTTKRFIKPTIEEIEAYCKERKNNINPSAFFDYYESKGWLVGKSPMKDWKAAIRNWERKDNKKSEDPFGAWF